MDNRHRTENLRKIARAALVTSFRLRFSEALRWASLTLPLPLLVAIVSLTFIKLKQLDFTHSRRWILASALCMIVVIAAALYQLLKKRALHEGAIALDRHHKLHDRLTNALSFSSIAQSQRTPLMEMAIDDGCAHVAGLRPRKAAPLRFPHEIWLPLGLSVCLVFVGLFEIRTRRTIAQAATIDAVTLTADDIDFFRDATKDLQARQQNPEMKAAIDKFNQLVEDISNKRLDRNEAFRRMEALESELAKATELDRKALEEGLAQLADELRKSDLTKAAADALKAKDLAKADQELRNLAQKMKANPKAFSKADLEKLRAALERAGKNQKERMAQLEQRRQELEQERDQLLRRRREAQDGGQNEEEERLLKRKERALERLDRELEQQRSAGRQLERLDRELSQAAEDLARDLGLSAQDLERSAEDLNRMAREQMTDQEKEELRRRIQELRELIRQHGQGGKGRIAKLRKFSQHARGQRGGRGQPGQQGQDGEGEEQEGQGQNGQGQGEGELVMGPNGKPMLVLSQGGAGRPSGAGMSGSGSQPGGGGDQPGGDGKGEGGKSWGTGHDSNLTGKGTNPKMGTQDVSAQAADTGQGANRSEVIAGAAERGFVGKGYKQVFTEYHTVAERAIGKEDVPPGYRFYVQRYFQLIRPRE